MNKAGRKNKNQAIAAALKARKIERTTARCPICYQLYNSNFLKAGFQAHRCAS